MNLLESTVNELMEKFGAGNHKPGSGSAAAFQGMVSAKLTSTVISLTLEKPQYSQYSTELISFQEQIEKIIYKRLAELFQIDSEQFDNTIKLRIARDKERDEATKNQLRRQALEELKISIETPLEIASLCKDLAEIAAYIFDNGFKSARGDSQVGLSGAVSAIAGCIAIIRLNLLAFNSSEYDYCDSVILKIKGLEKDYQELAIIADSKIKVLQSEFEEKIPLFKGLNDISKKYKNEKNINIEKCVRELQNLVWTHRTLIWKKDTPTNEIEILKPDSILKILGYDYFNSTNYGVTDNDGSVTKVAGIIDQPNKMVAISNNFTLDIQRFTAAHELGHSLLHNHSILHRDLPIASSADRRTRDAVEIQADKFATYFLMPEKLIKREFIKIYSSPKFILNEDSAFKFGGRSTTDLRKDYKNRRELAKKLASNTTYDNNHFVSLSELFNVSVEAMAIRLEELDLVDYR